jgi:diguanylate cyclase (GGDEF)-like protein
MSEEGPRTDVASAPARAMSPDAERGALDSVQVRFRLASVRVGVALTVIVCLGGEAYALATPGRPDRLALALLIAVGLLSAPLVLLLPREQIVRSRWGDLFFVCWSSGLIVLIAAVTTLDGGTESPLRSLFVLPLMFAALSYPPRSVLIVALLDLAGYGVVALIHTNSGAEGGFVAFALVCAAVLSTWQARNHHFQDERLKRAATALRKSESISRVRALQQEQVASFGQWALSGGRIADLMQVAVRSVQRTLGIEIAAVLEYRADEDNFLIRSGVGLPDDVVGQGTVMGGGRGSQAGLTLHTGGPVIVGDWAKETRFGFSEHLDRARVRSGATVPIKGHREPYGVLGAQSRVPHRFGVEDVNFLQAIANSLAHELERREEEDEARRRALHDPLTGLPNRALFLDRLGQALAEKEPGGAYVGVLFLDLDHFKLINDSVGHSSGDEMLKQVAPRLAKAVRTADTVARFGGDEFGALLPEVVDERVATRVAERIAAALAAPFSIAGHEHFVGVSVGIALGSAGRRPEDLIRDADTAMYTAKRRGRGRYELFDQEMRARLNERIRVDNELRTAIGANELRLTYQPVVALETGSVVGAEALVRWHHPERGLLMPEQFIGVAEETGLIRPLGRWVLETACREASGWHLRDPDARPIQLSVNVSARQLTPDFADFVGRTLEVAPIQPACLTLELTEDVLIDDDAAVRDVLARLRALGVNLAVDDFGTGYSSMGYLKRLPFRTIKLDRSFVRNLVAKGVDEAIVTAVIALGKALNLEVVAEGVETEEQLAIVRRLGCQFVQGHYFSPAVSAAELSKLLTAGVFSELKQPQG